MNLNTYNDRVNRIHDMLTGKLDELEEGGFHVFVDPFKFKDEPGIRVTVVRLLSTGKSQGQILTITYRRSKILSRRPENLVSGPFGDVKRILMERSA